MITTTSKHYLAKAMAEGIPPHKPFQWNGIHFIGFNVVRYDDMITEEEFYHQDFIRIKNLLTMEFYKVFMTQRIVPPAKAIDPKKLNALHLDGWEIATFDMYAGTLQIVASFKRLGTTPFYQVSFVRFTEWKSNALTSMIKK